ncbi:hypothetical protein LTS18_001879 [Coniosporium uncinatum]|uniref:Uncharacterized protein n=1 Tax=Coniosporium uncinatum TaxID=93489 RepID=A0ACC3D845_9PEZI|nr:hypothetical protein LTS18_001879 [Coniosporium uncinatum]
MSRSSSNKSNGSTERDGRLTDVPLQPYMTSATHQDPGATPTSQLRLLPDGTRVLTESDCYERTGMNFNASVMGNAVHGITQEFGVGSTIARLGQMVFLVAYAFGCELWAPWSEVYGRFPILQFSLLFVNIFQIPCALAKNNITIIIAQMLGGLSSAGGSVTLEMVADLWQPDEQQHAVNFVVLSSVGGSVVGPIVGCFIEHFLDWRWVFWISLIFGVVVQVAHYIFIPETLCHRLVTKEARRRRKLGSEEVRSEYEVNPQKITPRELLKTWYRPFYMFLTEPIVLCLSLLSGFSDALIFSFLEGFKPVYSKWGFGTIPMGLAFVPIGICYLIAYFYFFWPIPRNKRTMRRNDGELVPEQRLWGLLWTAPLLTIGLFGFAWTSLGPAYGIPWIAPMLFSVLVGIANFAIYMATIDYMVAAYGCYASSATDGNGFARDFLAGMAALFAEPLFKNMHPHPTAMAGTVPACIALVVTIPVYVFYWYGPKIREYCKYAKKIEAERQQKEARRVQNYQVMPRSTQASVFRGNTGRDVEEGGVKMVGNNVEEREVRNSTPRNDQ